MLLSHVNIFYNDFPEKKEKKEEEKTYILQCYGVKLLVI